MSLVAQIFTQRREVLDEGGGGVSDVPIAARLWSTKSVNSFPLDMLFRRSWLYDSGEPTNNDSSTTVATMWVKCKQVLVSVCVCATTLQAGKPRIVGSAPNTRNKFFLLCKASKALLWSTLLPIQRFIWFLLRVRAECLEADHAPPSWAEFKNTWIYSSTVMELCLNKHEGQFDLSF